MAIVLVSGDRLIRPAASGNASLAPMLREGFQWIFGQQTIRRVLSALVLSNLVASGSYLWVVYSLQRHGASSVRIGVLAGAEGCALLLGAAIALPLMARARAGHLLLGAMAANVALLCALPWLTGHLDTVVVYACAMAPAPIINAVLLSYFLHITPASLVGRASSVADLVTQGTTPLAPLLVGLGSSGRGRPSP